MEGGIERFLLVWGIDGEEKTNLRLSAVLGLEHAHTRFKAGGIKLSPCQACRAWLTKPEQEQK